MKSLTNLEKDILRLLAQGRSKRWMEYELSISRSTIYRNLGSIRRKLHTLNDIHSVAVAIKRGLIQPKGWQPQETKNQIQQDLSSLSPQCCDSLTKREKEVFALLGDTETSQWTNKRLARHLDISEGTLRKHLYHIYRKLGVANRAGAALLAAQIDIVALKNNNSE